jgi:ubiquitin-protein ligase
MSLDINPFIKNIQSLIINPINGKIIKLIKYNEGNKDVKIHFNIESYPVKITTDFDKFCIADSIIDNININHFNMTMVFKHKDPNIILEEISKLLDYENIKIKVTYSDPFHIFQKLDEFTKIEINYLTLEKKFNEFSEQSKSSKIIHKIPKDLLLSQNQICQLIINEMKKVNRSKVYSHYVISDPSNPYIIILRIKFNINTQIGKIFSEIKKNFGYDYVEIKLKLDPKTYPFIPPKLEYVKPKIKLSLLLSLMNLDILKLENWNSTITLEYLITNLGTQLESILLDYIIPDASSNSNTTIAFNELEYELIKLTSITKENSLEKVNINIDIPKIITVPTDSSKYWKSGTGYGSKDSRVWDIKNYIKEQELQKYEITKILLNINKIINDSNINIINESILLNYIINQIKGLNMLEFEKNRDLFIQIFNIIENIRCTTLPQYVINAISISLISLNEEIDMLFKTSQESLQDESILHIYCISDWYLSKYQEPIQEIIISTDLKEQYCQVMKPLQFGSSDISLLHRFIKFKGVKPEQKAMIRILSEITSFKSGLPLNWESTIWVRISKDNINLFSFIISGPKDTPYENGLFEFHACFPQDYPNKEPSVLLHTTGNDTVRFNPNLYNNGKVCLSLLGTWHTDQDGEKWNAQTSTFLQVMVSIQSLILIENPYFNEPGLEREINTANGTQRSNTYNEERQPHTINLAMIDMIKNPPNGFEEIVKNHFRMKKDEIINRTLIWEHTASKHKPLIQSNRNELIKLLDKI